MTLVSNYRVTAAALAFLASAVSQTTYAKDVTEQITISGLAPIAQTRVSRTIFEYTYKIDIANSGSPLAGVVASLTSSSPKIQIVDATVNLGDLPGYAQGASKDTFSVRIDRSAAFDPSALHWQVNGEEARDVCNSIPAITLKTPTIQQTLPSSGSTGSSISLIGTGLNTCSLVYLGSKEISDIEVISDRKLQITLPFDVDSQSQLIPLAAGTYPVKVDTSSVYSFSVTNLPENPFPPGQLATEHISNTFQDLARVLPEYQALLPQLMENAKNEPNTRSFLHGLADLGSYLNTSGTTVINELEAQLDSNTLDSFERTLALGKSKPTDTFSAIKAASTVSSTQAKQIQSIQLPGDQWLIGRAALVQSAQIESKVAGKASFWCLSLAKLALSKLPTPIIQPPPLSYSIAMTAGKTCLAIVTAATVAQIMTEIVVAKHPDGGVIKGIELYVYAPADYKSTLGFLPPHQVLGLSINNADNNENGPTYRAKNITGAGLLTSHNFDAAQLLSTLKSTLDEIKAGILPKNSGTDAVALLVDYAGSKLTDLFKSVIDQAANQPTETQDISPMFLEGSLLTAEFYNSTLIGDTPDCQIPEPNGTSATKMLNGASSIVVPDHGMSQSGLSSFGTCKVTVPDFYRLPSEDNVYSILDFRVKRYPKMTVTVIGNGTVDYTTKAISGSTKCTGGQTCTEYFDAANGLVVGLTAKPQDAGTVSWEGQGTENCKQGDTTCQVKLDKSYQVPLVLNENPPSINVTLGNNIQCTDSDRVQALQELTGAWTDANTPGYLRLTIDSGGESGKLELMDGSTWGCPAGGNVTLGWLSERALSTTAWSCLASVTFQLTECANAMPWVFYTSENENGQKSLNTWSGWVFMK